MAKENKEISLAKWARDEFAKELRNSGLYSYVSDISRSYADIEAIKNDGTRVFFEIKASAVTNESLNAKIQKGEKYFGAATLTEWKAAMQHPDNYLFIFLYVDTTQEEYVIIGREEYRPAELLGYSTVPPFKINLNIPYKRGDNKRKSKHREGTVSAKGIDEDYSVIEKLVDIYQKIGGDLIGPNKYK